MEPFTLDLVSNVSEKLFLDDTLSSFANFQPEYLTLEGQLEVTISETSYRSMYQNFTEGKNTVLIRDYNSG